MTAKETTEVPLTVWLSCMLSSITCLVPAMFILICERRKREKVPLFASKYLSFFSYFVIIIVPVSQTNVILVWFPGTCVISQNVLPPLFALVYCSLEYYQLSRLYYCFSIDKVHSNRGYPKWLFVLIVCLVGVELAGGLLSYYGEIGLTSQCGFRTNGDAYLVRYYPFDNNAANLIAWMSFLLSPPPDLLILAMYCWKARSLTTRNGLQDGQNKVYIRVRLILNRVIILSFFYWIIFLFWCLISIIEPITVIFSGGKAKLTYNIPMILVAVVPVCVSYSVYLMQDHNTKEYIHFLSILNKYKLYFCCCCCYGMVRDQYQFVLDNEEEPITPKRKTSCTWDTRNISEYEAGVEEMHHVTGIELSIATKTECHVVEEEEEVDVVYLEDIDYQTSIESK